LHAARDPKTLFPDRQRLIVPSKLKFRPGEQPKQTNVVGLCFQQFPVDGSCVGEFAGLMQGDSALAARSIAFIRSIQRMRSSS
jgi:hypothetical protein